MLYVLLVLIILLLALILAQQIGVEEAGVEDDPMDKMWQWFMAIVLGLVIIGAVLYWAMGYLKTRISPMSATTAQSAISNVSNTSPDSSSSDPLHLFGP